MFVLCSYFRYCGRSQWPRGLRRVSKAASLLGLWFRIPPEAWMSVCCECCVLSGRGLCDALITRPEESYRLRCVVVCDLETWRMWRPWPALGRSAIKKNNKDPVGRYSHSLWPGCSSVRTPDGTRFSSLPIPALKPTQPPIQRAPGRKAVRTWRWLPIPI